MRVQGQGVGLCFGCDEYNEWLTLVNSGGAWCVAYGCSTLGVGSVVCKEDLI